MLSHEPVRRPTLVHAPDDRVPIRPSPVLPEAEGLALSVSPVLGGPLVEVHARGDIDMITAPCFGRTLARATALLRRTTGDSTVAPAPRPPAVLCDLSGIEFFGAAGVRALLEGASDARGHGVALRVVPSRRVHRVLALTGTDSAVALCPPTPRRPHAPDDEGDRR